MQIRSFCSITLLALLLAALTGCEKKDKPITLPPAGSALPGKVTMGENYDTQIFYDFEKNTVVATSSTTDWDLAFEAAADGAHVFMNGGKGIFLYNTHKTTFSSIRVIPTGMTSENYLYDDASGNPDSTAVGNWRNNNNESLNEVFVARLAVNTYYKFSLLSVNNTGYRIAYAKLEDSAATVLAIPKNDSFNFSYFSFAKGLVAPEPPKATWDVVFTRYRFIYRDLNNFPYEVNGVLLNPYKVVAAADSTSTFDALTYANTSGLQLSANRDVIGYDWKTYDIPTAKYSVKKNKCYVLHTRNDKVFKLHFLDFYSTAGVKGTPSFESQELR